MEKNRRKLIVTDRKRRRKTDKNVLKQTKTDRSIKTRK